MVRQEIDVEVTKQKDGCPAELGPVGEGNLCLRVGGNKGQQPRFPA